MNWQKRPMLLEYWPREADVIMGMDESGTSDINSIKKMLRQGKPISEHDKHFTLTGVVFNKKGYEVLKQKMNEIKFKYWENGLCEYKGTLKRVCFHSREIRRRDYPFNLIENYDEFLNELTKMVAAMPTKVLSCTINKEQLCKTYITPHHPYHLAVRFILERFCGRLNQLNKRGVILLESRGKKEDKFVLKHIVEVIENGTNKNPKEHFKSLVGVYFNPKWWKRNQEQSSFVILELADLISYPIYKYIKTNNPDPAFQTIERKILNYPQYYGWGLKVFP